MAPRRTETFCLEFLANLFSISMRTGNSACSEIAAKPVNALPLPMLTGLELASQTEYKPIRGLLPDALQPTSLRNNFGTWGLLCLSEQLYIETALDCELIPAVLAGEFRLVMTSGNAGDGKTASCKKLAARARDEQGAGGFSLPNGCRFTLRGRRFLGNYDGSQDEGDQPNEAVLDTFLLLSREQTRAAWPDDENARLIAINEGDLLTSSHS